MHIGTGISEYLASKASQVVDEILDACETISHMPARYSRLPRHEDSGLRRRVFGRYLIIFLIDNDEIQIVRILPGSMDIDAILFGDDGNAD